MTRNQNDDESSQGLSPPVRDQGQMNSPDGKGQPRGQFSIMERVRRTRELQTGRVTQVDPPIDPSSWFDIVLSCGFGAKSYKLGPSFARPEFRVRFAKKIFIVLLVQLTVYLFLMGLILTSNSFEETLKENRAYVGVAVILYLSLYSAVRWTRCGGEGLCFIGYMFILIIMTWCLVFATAILAQMFPCWMLTGAAIWFTLVLIIIGNCFIYTNILGDLMYGVAFFGGLVSGGIMMTVILNLNLKPESTEEMLKQFILPLTLIPSFFSLLLVHEIKKLIGGRRTNLQEDHWMIASIVM